MRSVSQIVVRFFYLSFISERTCKVPAGKALFIPVMMAEWSQKEAPKDTAQDLVKAATTDQDSVNSLYFKIGDLLTSRRSIIRQNAGWLQDIEGQANSP